MSWTCPECKGVATDDGTEWGEPCPMCAGDGIIEPWMLDLECALAGKPE